MNLRIGCLVGVLMAGLLPEASRAQAGPACPGPLSIERGTTGGMVLRWHAAAGTTQLVWAPDFAAGTAWQVVPGTVPLGGE